jgi:hypothetical protein
VEEWRACTHYFGEVELDLGVEVFQDELAVFSSGEHTEEEKAFTLPTQEVFDRSELWKHHT